MLRAFKFMANLVIVGFVIGRAYNEWQHRHRIVAVRPSRTPPLKVLADEAKIPR